jgi:hypothetical protein
MPDRTTHQKEIIQAVLNRYNTTSGLAYSVTRWPDEEERNSRACDAYAESSGQVPLAIEHTLIPSFDLQKKHDAQFMKVIGDLEAELKHSFPFDLSLSIPMFAIQKGQDWLQIKTAVKSWLLANTAAIPAGRSKVSIPGVPFEVELNRDDDLPPLFSVARWLDSSLNIPEQLTGCIAGALADKDDQLTRYWQDGNQTLLILESQDIALVNRGMIYQAFLAAQARVNPKRIGQVWLAETYEPDRDYLFIYCLLADQGTMDRVNPPNAMFGPRFAAHWAKG